MFWPGLGLCGQARQSLSPFHPQPAEDGTRGSLRATAVCEPSSGLMPIVITNHQELLRVPWEKWLQEWACLISGTMALAPLIIYATRKDRRADTLFGGAKP